MGPAMARIGHYFTPFQAHVVGQAELDVSRFAMDQALLILEREAKYKADGPSLRRPLRLPVRDAVAKPAGLRQGPRSDRRRPELLLRRLARLHPHSFAPGSATSISPT